MCWKEQEKCQVWHPILIEFIQMKNYKDLFSFLNKDKSRNNPEVLLGKWN